jgi:hypothetical protein
MERTSVPPTLYTLVKFIPSVLDKLFISTGETMCIVAEYDDWATCADAHGEQDVVPLECLGQTRDRGRVDDLQPSWH